MSTPLFPNTIYFFQTIIIITVQWVKYRVAYCYLLLKDYLKQSWLHWLLWIVKLFKNFNFLILLRTHQKLYYNSTLYTCGFSSILLVCIHKWHVVFGQRASEWYHKQNWLLGKTPDRYCFSKSLRKCIEVIRAHRPKWHCCTILLKAPFTSGFNGHYFTCFIVLLYSVK